MGHVPSPLCKVSPVAKAVLKASCSPRLLGFCLAPKVIQTPNGHIGPRRELACLPLPKVPL